MDQDEEFKIKKIQIDKSEVRRYPKRQIGVKNYEEIEEPEDDRYVYCDNCEDSFVDNCSKCGKLAYLQDDKVDMGVENRAKLTVPKSMLVIMPSPIHGFGVFARVPLKKGIKMGPYEGRITKVESTAGYSWKLRDGRLVDAADEKFSNWMRFINCARHVAEQNVMAFQYRGNLYYRTCSDIKAGQELLVYYGQSFAENLGIDVRNYFKPKEEEISVNHEWCPHCNYAYKDSSRLRYHVNLCKWNPKNVRKVTDKLFFCSFCPAGLKSEEDFKKHEKRCKMRKIEVKENVKKNRRTKTQNLQTEIYHCENCKYSSNNKYYFQIHRRLHEKFFSIACKICKKGFNHYQNFKCHMIKHLDVAKSVTDLKTTKICEEKARKKMLQVQFSKFEMNITIYECAECNYTTPKITDMKKHTKTHRKTDLFCCYNCEFKSENINDMKLHLNSEHNLNCDEFCRKHIKKKSVNRSGYTCGICNHVFIERSQLKCHLESTHLNEKNYKCHLCDYSAYGKQILEDHLNAKHFKSEKYECNHCKYFSFYKNNLSRHCRKKHLYV